MFKAILFDREGILRKTLELSKFTDYISVPEREICPHRFLQEADSKLAAVGNPQTRFVYSHIIQKTAHWTELYYAER